MSVTFSSDAPESAAFADEHCLCAQLAPGFMGDAKPEALKAAANPRCLNCKGEGIERVPTSDAPTLNLANANAIALLRALRLGGVEGDLVGSCSIPEARRAVIRAGSGDVSRFARPEAIEHGKPRSEGNVVIARPIRSWDMGLSAEGLRARLDDFASLVEECAARGATIINWC